MRWTRILTKSALALFGVSVALATVPVEALAQLAVSRPEEKLLFLTLRPTDGLDTSFTLELASEVRRRLSSQMRHKLIVYSDDQICKVLEPSGYACDAILSPAEATLLASTMQASAFIIGDAWRESATPWARYRIVDVSGTSGLSGWQSVRGTPGDPPDQFARTIVDSLENEVEAAERARECLDRRNRGDFDDAMERAQRAFRIYPNHPTAAICAWYASEQLHQPLDSQVQYLRRAVRGDSLNARNWERLGRQLRQKGDTLEALDAFRHQTLLQPNDRELRVAVIAGAVGLREYDVAVDLANSWIDSHPADSAMVEIKLSACVNGEMWRCALETHAAMAQRDTSLLSDSTFYQQMIGYTQALGDTHAQMTWTQRAVERFPDSPAFLRARVSAFAGSGMTDSLIVYYDRLLAMDSTDVRAALAGAELLLGEMQIDTSVAPLDTAALMKGVAYLNALTAATQDSTVLTRAAVLYYSRGSELVRMQLMIPTAVEMLERALASDVRHVLTENANFFLAYGLVLQIFQLDPQVVESKSCAMVDEEAELIAKGLEAVQIGINVAPAAQQFRENLQSMRDRIPALRQSFSCP